MKRFLLLICLLTFGVLPLLSQGTWIGINQNKPVTAGASLVSSNIQTTKIHFSLDGYFQTPIRTHLGTEMIIGSHRGVGIDQKAAPDLGKLYADIIIPDMDQMQVKVLRADYTEYHNIFVAPSKGSFSRQINPEDIPFEYGEVYTQNEFWPGKLAQLEDPYIMRDFRGQTITVFPFQYNPVTKTLRVYTDIVIEVTSTGKQGENILARNKELSSMESEFRQIYNHFFLNMEYYNNNKYILEEDGSMLIIVFDDFADAMLPFVNWKRQTGRRTQMVLKSEVGNTAAAIKTYVENYYHQNTDFTYLLLVGDAPQIPAMTTSWGHSDNAFGFLVGNDQYNEIFVGRFSAENVAHVQTQVQRMIEYERDLDETDTWMRTAMGIAKNEGTGNGHNGGENDYVHMDFIRDSLLNFTYDVVYRNYTGNVPGVPNITATEMSAHFNQGVSITNFCNHGNITGWSVANYNISHVNALTNVGRLPYIWSVACVNGAFVNNFCFAEAWLRATHEGQPTGAIGMMAATINQDWRPPMTGQDEMVTILVEKRDHIKRTFGGLSINGSMKMISAHPLPQKGIETHVTWVLFGDPSLQVRTSTPETIFAAYDPVILMDATSYTVQSDADGAMVALTYFDELLGERIIIGTARVSDGSATINFDLDFTEPLEATLTITGFNKRTYINEDIQIVPPAGPYVIFNNFEINDQAGNNNGQADYGEIIYLNLSLKNVGIELAQEVQGVISTQDENVTILQNQATWGDIPQSGSVMQENAFRIKIGDAIPNNHNVIFDIIASDQEGNEWASKFNIRIFSPLFTIGDLQVDDGQGGNGRLDPGETANLLVRYTNTGGAPAMNPRMELFAQSPYFTIINNSVEPGIILPGEYVDAGFTVSAHPSVAEGTYLDLVFDVEAGQYFSSNQFIYIGQQPQTYIGTGNTDSHQYPFYNYYKANRTQMLYLGSEFGSGEKIITDIGFNIKRFSSQHNNFPNFQIRIKEVPNQTMPGSFINTSDNDIVFQAENYQMPAENGWFTIELQQPFVYTGENNLLVEVRFGILSGWTNNYYIVACSDFPAGSNMVAFGYSDNANPPNFNGATTRRPNLFLQFQAEGTADSQPVSFVIKNQFDQLLEDASVKIGSLVLQTNQQGAVNFELFPGDFSFSAMAANHRSLLNEPFQVIVNQPLEINVLLMKTFKVNFSISNRWGHVIDWAVITVQNQALAEGVCTVEDLVPGTYSFTIHADYHLPYNGQFIISDTNLDIDILMTPDPVTGIELLPIDAVAVFPNPFTNYLNVAVPEGVVADLVLVNVLGEIVSTRAKVSGNQNFALSNLPAGQYFLQIITKNGKETRKITKM
jgi:hypothetical protein